MTILSITGTVTAFGVSLLAVLAWFGAGALTFMLCFQASPASSNRFNRETQLFTLEGSWVPLGLILGIFLVKYVAGHLSRPCTASLKPNRTSDFHFQSLWHAFCRPAS